MTDIARAIEALELIRRVYSPRAVAAVEADKALAALGEQRMVGPEDRVVELETFLRGLRDEAACSPGRQLYTLIPRLDRLVPRDTSLRPRPGESAEQTVERVVNAVTRADS